jgi:hypothetical protein
MSSPSTLSSSTFGPKPTGNAAEGSQTSPLVFTGGAGRVGSKTSAIGIAVGGIMAVVFLV